MRFSLSVVAVLLLLFVPEEDSWSSPPVAPAERLSVGLAGDSTVASYDENSPSQGWGWALGQWFDDQVSVNNHARGGRSSKSFRTEGFWEPLLAEKPAVVLIQFGHNDNPGKGPERETNSGPDGDFRANLRRYVEEARATGATVVLVTPTARRFFTPDGKRISPTEGNIPYAEACRAVAKELETPLVDLNLLTTEYFEQHGDQASAELQPPDDRTHFTPAGARVVAQMVARELARQLPEFKAHAAEER